MKTIFKSNKLNLALIMLALISAVSACNYDIKKMQPGNGDTFGKVEAVSFAIIKEKVFDLKKADGKGTCTGCHAWANSYEQVGSLPSRFEEIIKRSVNLEGRQMPPISEPPLTNEQKGLLVAWQKAGFPKGEVGPAPEPSPSPQPSPEPSPMPSPQPSPTPSPSPAPSTPYGWADAEKLLTMRCLICHGPNAEKTKLHTYELVYEKKDKVKEATVAGKMPTGKPLNKLEQAMLNSWIDGGAPKEGNQLNYENVSKVALKESCLGCHSPDGQFEPYLETYQNLFEKRETVSKAINHADGVTPMPLGEGKLTDDQIRLFDTWLSLGAPEK